MIYVQMLRPSGHPSTMIFTLSPETIMALSAAAIWESGTSTASDFSPFIFPHCASAIGLVTHTLKTLPVRLFVSHTDLTASISPSALAGFSSLICTSYCELVSFCKSPSLFIGVAPAALYPINKNMNSHAVPK